MTGFEKFIYQHLHRLRRTVQWLAVFFIILVPILNRLHINDVMGTFYSLRLGNLDIVDPALMVQAILLTKKLYFPMLLAGVIPLIIALFFGKVFCSWICPYNLLAEYTEKLRRIIRPSSVRERHHNPKSHYYWLIYGSILSLVAVLGLPIITLISMPGLITGTLADLLLFGTLGLEIILVFVLLIIELFFAPRFWCKYACPVGATLEVLRNRHTLKVRFNPHKCIYSQTHRLPCHDACPLHLNPMRMDIYPYCFNCGDCVDACRVEGQALNYTLQPAGQPPTVQIDSKKEVLIK